MWKLWWSELWFSCSIFHFRFWTHGCLKGKQRFIRLESWCWRYCAGLRSFSLYFTPSIQPGSSRSKQAPCIWISPGLHPILSPLSEHRLSVRRACPSFLAFSIAINQQHRCHGAARLPSYSYCCCHSARPAARWNNRQAACWLKWLTGWLAVSR